MSYRPPRLRIARQAIPLPLAIDGPAIVRRGARLLGFCRVCFDDAADVPCRKHPDRSLLCLGCGLRQSATEALAEPWAGAVNLRDWDRASWAVDRERADLDALDMAPAFDAALAGILKRADAYRGEVAAVRAELDAAGVRVVVRDDGPALVGRTERVTPALLARVKTVREELIGEC